MQIARFLIQSILIGLIVAGSILGYRHWQLSQHEHQTPGAASPTTLNIVPASQYSANSGPYSYAQAVNKAIPAVVNIYTTKKVSQSTRFNNPLYDRFFGQQYDKQSNSRIETGSGSGVIFSAEGFILTNYHVIEDTQNVHVLLNDGRDFPARIIGVDPDTDLAVLKIEATGLQAILLAEGDSTNIGDIVLAIGNPFGVGQTVTMGIVSATGRDRLGLSTFENFIQTDAAINPGNSGGALVDALGNLVGINTAIFTKDGGTQGIGFAIPVSLATDVLSQILKNGRVIRGWIGAEGRDLSEHGKKLYKLPSGVAIVGVVPGGPADMAGIKTSDILTHINDIAIKDVKDILSAVSSRSPGEAMKVKGIRKGKTYEATLIVVQRPLLKNRRR
jgi:serine protease DegS